MNHPNGKFPDELISAYLDGELTAEEQAQVEELLRTSAEHRQMFEELSSLRSTLQSLPEHKLSADFYERVLRRAERAMLAAPPKPADVEHDAEREAAPSVIPIAEAASRRKTISLRVVIGIASTAAAAVLAAALGPWVWQRGDVAIAPDAAHVADQPADAPSPAAAASDAARSRADAETAAANGPLDKAAGDAANRGIAETATASPPAPAPQRSAPQDGLSAGGARPAVDSRARPGTPLPGDLPRPLNQHDGGLDRSFADDEHRKLRGGGQGDFGGGAAGGGLSPSRTPFQAQGAGPFSEALSGHIAQHAKSAAARLAGPDAEVILIHLTVTPEALRDGAFDRLLARHDIVFDAAEKAYAESADRKTASPLGRAAQEALARGEANQALAARRSRTEEASQSARLQEAEGAVDFVYVEADADQLLAAVADLKSEFSGILSLEVASPKTRGLDASRQSAAPNDSLPRAGATVDGLEGVPSQRFSNDGRGNALSQQAAPAQSEGTNEKSKNQFSAGTPTAGSAAPPTEPKAPRALNVPDPAGAAPNAPAPVPRPSVPPAPPEPVESTPPASPAAGVAGKSGPAPGAADSEPQQGQKKATTKRDEAGGGSPSEPGSEVAVKGRGFAIRLPASHVEQAADKLRSGPAPPEGEASAAILVPPPASTAPAASEPLAAPSEPAHKPAPLEAAAPHASGLADEAKASQPRLRVLFVLRQAPGAAPAGAAGPAAAERRDADAAATPPADK